MRPRGNGYVRRFHDGSLDLDPVLDLAVHSRSERGLLGIARDPDFINNQHVYLYYTESPTGEDTQENPDDARNKVARFTWNGSALVDRKEILDLPVTPGYNHVSGVLRFGHDDRLYVILGDLNRQGLMQNIDDGGPPNTSGGVIRVDVNGRAPSDNPFYDVTNPDWEMNRNFSYGLRNSFGLTFDPVTGDLWETGELRFVRDRKEHSQGPVVEGQLQRLDDRRGSLDVPLDREIPEYDRTGLNSAVLDD